MAPINDYLMSSPQIESMGSSNQLFHPFVSHFTVTEKNIPLHYHQELEIIIPFNVTGETFCSGKRYTLRHGKAQIISPNDIHAFRISSPGRGEVLVLKFDINACKTLLNDSAGVYSTQVNFKGDSALLTGYLKKLIQLYNSERQSVSPEAVSLLFQIIQVLFEHPPTEQTREGHPAILRVLDQLEQKFQEPLELDKLAKVSGLSKFHLCRLFKESTGTTIGNHLTTLRINRAATLFSSGERNVTEVCYACGFEELSYFIQVFKKAMGKTPKQWMKNNVFKNRVERKL